MLDQAVETIQVPVQTKLHRLTIHKPFGPVYVNGDLARLVQSLGNILHNAPKYTDPGGEIEVDVQESNGDHDFTGAPGQTRSCPRELGLSATRCYIEGLAHRLGYREPIVCSPLPPRCFHYCDQRRL